MDSDGPLTWVDDAGCTWWQSASGRWYLDRALLFGGTLLGDVVAAAGGASAVQFLGLVVVVPVVQVVLLVRPVLGQVVDMLVIVNNSGGGRSLLQFIDKLWTSLRLCSDAVSQWEVSQIQFIA